MLLEIITNRWVMMVICGLLVFAEMFVAKKWFTSFTVKIKDETARRGVNVLLGMITCFALASAQMYALCDVFKTVYNWAFVIASALGATGLYLIIEKIFGESKLVALGKVFREFISHSDLFDGELTIDGVVAVAKKLHNITIAIDKKEAEKETKAVEGVVERMSQFLVDGKITAEEKAEAEELIKSAGEDFKKTSTYEKYKAMLGE